MAPDADDIGLEDVLLLDRFYFSSLLFQRSAIWCISFNLYPSNPPIISIIFLKITALWKVLGWGASPVVSIFINFLCSISN
jgi:hypothetical protein